MRVLFLAVTFGCFFSTSAFSYDWSTNPGDGSAANPYQISTAEQLMSIGSDSVFLTRNYIQTNDIDLAGQAFKQAVIAPDTSVSNGFQGAQFTGNFNGNGHIISNLKISNGYEYIGLFGYIGSTGQVKKLRIVNINITGKKYVSGLCGRNYGSISQCCATGTVTGYIGIGGLCGNNYGFISQCYTSGTVDGKYSIGGLCGTNNGGSISQSYARVVVTGDDELGGLCGDIYGGTIDQCYATGTVTGEWYTGGLCGYSFGVITDSYWDIESSGQTGGSVGWGLTGVQMKQAASFEGWNDGAWTIDEGNDTPHLFWENTAGNMITTNYIDRVYMGSGTIEDPYQIVDVNDLLCLGQRRPDWDKHFILNKDIKLTDVTFVHAVIAGGGGVFNGTFNGNNHVISHLRISGPDQNYIGLFGQIGPNAQVNDLTLVDVNSVGRICVGGLCGSNAGIVNQCSVNGAVNGFYGYIGGLCGVNSGTIGKSYFNGKMTGGSWIGGLCGENIGTINQSYSMNSVTGFWGVAGLCGDNQGIMMHCYVAGTATGDMVGGLCGDHSGSIIHCFWDSEISGLIYGIGIIPHGQVVAEGKTTAEMKTLSTFTSAGWDFTTDDGDSADWYMPDGYYPQLLGFPTTICPNVMGMSPADAQTVIKSVGLDSSVIAGAFSMSVPAGYIISQSPAEGINVNIGSIVGLIVSLGRGGGSGTETDPYQIWTAEQFNKIGADSSRWNKYFTLMADIDMSVYSDSQYNIIGNDSTPFTGTFDGNGHKIINLTCTLPGSNDAGVFGHTSNAAIKNLCLEGITIDNCNYAGGLVGEQYGGSITNCYVTGSVTAYVAGGLVGWFCGGVITNCSSTSSVNSFDSGGGLVGCQVDGIITGCYSTGSVNSFNNCSCFRAGGLVGWQGYGSIMYCYSTASVHLNDPEMPSYAGGLVGESYGSIAYCFGTGDVTGNVDPNYSGGLIGFADFDSTIDCFWDIQSSGLNHSAGGIGKTSAEMKTLSIFTTAGWDFTNESANGTSDIWRMCTDGADYPRLSWESARKGDFVCPNGTELNDFAVLSQAWLTTDESMPYNRLCDMDGDNIVDMKDLLLFTDFWLQKYK